MTNMTKNYCKNCKRSIENLNLSIYHNCSYNISPYIWDTQKDDNFYCYNYNKNTTISEFYEQIVFVKEIPQNNFPSILESKGSLILKLLVQNFFDFNKINTYDKLILFSSKFSDEGGQKWKKFVKNLKNGELEQIILDEIKTLIIDIYYLILAIQKSGSEDKKHFFSFLTEYKEESPNEYKDNIINFIKENIELKEKMKMKIYSTSNNNEYIYLPRKVSQIINIEKKYLIFTDESNDTKLLYSIENNKILSSCEGIKKMIRINDYNYIGLNQAKELVMIEIKINFSENYAFFDVVPIYKYKDLVIVDFYVLSNDKLIIVDELKNIILMIKSNDNNYFISKSTKAQIKGNTNCQNIKIFVDTNNQIFSIYFSLENSLFNYFYDFDLNPIKFLIINKFSRYGYFTIKILNKDFYIIFEEERTYLISSKYLEIISIYKDIYFNCITDILLFHNSNEFFIKNLNRHIYHYKLIKNELKMIKIYNNNGTLKELKEINNNGDYSILYNDSYSYQKYYIKNNIKENHSYNFEHDFVDDSYKYFSDNNYNLCDNYNEKSFEESGSDDEDFGETETPKIINRKINTKKIPINFELVHNCIRTSTKNRHNELSWIPLTKLGILSKCTINNIEQIFYYSVPIKEDKIIDNIFLNNYKTLKEECISIKNIGKNKFKAIVIIGDSNGHIGLGVKTSDDMEKAIKDAGKEARLNIIPVRRGFFEKKEIKVYTITNKVEGKSGSVKVQLIPAPKGTGLSVTKEAKKIFQFAGIEDIIMKSYGNKNNLENLLKAIYNALFQSYTKNDLPLITKDWDIYVHDFIFEKYNEELKEYYKK